MQVTVGQVSGLLLKATGLNQRFVGQALVEHGQDDQQQRSRTGHDPEPDVEEKNHRQIDGKPGRIEKGEQCRAGDKLPHLGQVIEGLPGLAVRLTQVACKGRAIHFQVDPLLQLIADADNNETSDGFQHTDKYEEADDHQRQHPQGRFVLR
ncbi:hypothetical protein D3C75_925970 [compost metagenome]